MADRLQKGSILLQAALERVETTSVGGVFFRHVPGGGAPLFRPEQPADGRWQRGEMVEGFYLAGDEQAAWAEWYRALAELAVPPMRQMPRDLWRFRVGLKGVADLSDVARLTVVGLSLPRPSRSQWPRFQTVGEALAADGWTGILYPSAARPGGAPALCVFRREAVMAGIEPEGPPFRHEEPPVPPGGPQDVRPGPSDCCRVLPPLPSFPRSLSPRKRGAGIHVP